MRVLLISGSTRTDSVHSAVVRTAAGVASGGVTATVYDDLRSVPAFVPGEPAAPDPVILARHRVSHADALVFCTPEYSGALPGALKNLLDHLVESGTLQGKAAAWLAVGAPGQDDGARNELETVLDLAGAKLLRAACVRLPLGPDVVGPDGLITDSRLPMAALDVMQSMERAMALMAAPKELPSWQQYSSVYPIVMRQAGTRPPAW